MAAALLAALSVSERIKTYGAYAGFAAVLGLAVLALLYFAQAREVKRLREWAGRAPERALELEERIQADATRRAALAARPIAAQTPAAQTPRPAQAGAATAAAQQGATTPAQQGATAPPTAPEQPGAPPKPGAAPVPAGATAPAPAGAAATAASAAPPGAPAQGGPTAPAKADAPAGADAKPPTAKPEAPAGPPQPGAPAPPAAQPAPAAPLAAGAAASATRPAGNGTGSGALGTVPPAPRLPTVGQPPPAGRPSSSTLGTAGPGTERLRSPRSSRRSPIWALIGGGVVVLVGLIVLITQVFGGGGDKGTRSANTHKAAPPVIPTRTSGTPARKDFKVTVLNGTTVTGLARSVANTINAKGYEIAAPPANAPEQGRAATVVMFTPGHRQDAFTIAKLISVGRDAVQPIDQNTLVLASGAAVVVTVGADQTPE
jgi:LytR cell envelope-related transcriptional attenuator